MAEESEFTINFELVESKTNSDDSTHKNSRK